MTRVFIVQGHAWHLIPQNAPIGLTFKSWTESGDEFALLSYGKDGILLLTRGTQLPPLPSGWIAQPFTGLADWTATVDGRKWKLLHEFPDGLCVFAGIVI